MVHTFAGNPLDRADVRRRDPAWLAAAAHAPRSRFLPLWQLNVLVDGSQETPRLGWLSRSDIDRLDVTVPPVFLGLDEQELPHFALDISEVNDPSHELALGGGVAFQESRSAAMSLPTADTGVLAQARAQINWHRSHRYCSTCGAPTRQEKGGHQRVCEQCNASHFPRTDPVAIMLIVDDEHCLLGQSHGPLVRIGMFSALAGFIDQGESIEEAVRREVREEAGIEVGAVRYHSSQPWPFPSSLMIGCHGQALSREIQIDTEEMHDVRWVPRKDVRAALAGEHPTLKVPGGIAIAHHLIRAWAQDEIRFD
ncbi:MAG: NAD(+) diphosphatase [Pseudomonadales bacterium]|jgi:NAD+ diphosphatase|nr:NAD(+) diphosphatase [Pseudomonadales bacterium]